MATIKSRKITKIVREFVKQDASYDITGVDLGLAKYLWRVSQDTFQDLAAGDYRIDQSNGKQTLVILNAELLAQAEAFQVGYVLDFTASEYDTEWNVDINQLKEKYNTLVQNTQSLWEYVRLTGFIADDTTINLILPQLDDNQFWFYQDGKYKAYDVSDFRQLGESLIEAYAEYQKSVIELMVRNARENIQNNVDNGVASIQNLLDSLNLNVENFTGDKKLELQKIINDFRKELEVVSVGNANTVQGYVPMDFDRVEKNIEDVKNSIKYKAGDIIEVLGMVNGDGKYHRRVMTSVEMVEAVKTANNLWANVYSNRFEDVRLETVDKTLVGAINENKDRIDGQHLETEIQDNGIWGGEYGGKIQDPIPKELNKRYIDNINGKAFICIKAGDSSITSNTIEYFTPCNVVDNLDKLQNLVIKNFVVYGGVTIDIIKNNKVVTVTVGGGRSGSSIPNLAILQKIPIEIGYPKFQIETVCGNDQNRNLCLIGITTTGNLQVYKGDGDIPYNSQLRCVLTYITD